jgi:hypothetical protein
MTSSGENDVTAEKIIGHFYSFDFDNLLTLIELSHNNLIYDTKATDFQTNSRSWRLGGY